MTGKIFGGAIAFHLRPEVSRSNRFVCRFLVLYVRLGALFANNLIGISAQAKLYTSVLDIGRYLRLPPTQARLCGRKSYVRSSKLFNRKGCDFHRVLCVRIIGIANYDTIFARLKIF